jgi:protein-L-isoaspartate O-methyltransferase
MLHPPGSQPDWKQDSKRFDGVAQSYDIYRPSYPEELLDALITTTDLRSDSKILEIGSGTGKATLMLAQRGLSVHCIEPGRNLVDVAARNLADYPRVTFEVVTFEEWGVPPGEYDLILSAQAFHWIPREIAYTKTAQALKAGGHLALIWNMPPDLSESADRIDEDFVEIEEVYRACAPEMGGRPESSESRIRQREQDIWESGVFRNVRTSTFLWSVKYDVQSYLGLLNTYSDHLRLPEEKRESLYQGIAEVIRRHGGYLEKPYLAVLYVAEKAPQCSG